jgi:cytochrome b involved in lipid metabolism
MNHRTLLGSVALIVLLLTGTYVVVNSDDARSDSAIDVPDMDFREAEVVMEGEVKGVPSSEQEESILEEVTEDDEVTSVAVAPESKPTPTPTPTPIPVPVPTPAGYTLAQVSRHNDESSCWTIVGEGVYDLTPFIKKHPGGARNILKICGKDGTSAFMGQHGGNEGPESTLAEYRLGAYSE